MAPRAVAGAGRGQVKLNVFATCFECEYSFTAEDLVEKHLAVIRGLGILPDERDFYPYMITICPECSSDLG